MTNVTVFIKRYIKRDGELYNKIKDHFGENFIDIVDFPNGVPIAWQDGKLYKTGIEEPTCDCFQALFGVKNYDELDFISFIAKFRDYGFDMDSVPKPIPWNK